MFSGFPLLDMKMIKLLFRQGFRYFVQQPYPGNPKRDGKSIFLVSPFFAKDKATYYFKRLMHHSAALLYDLDVQQDLKRLCDLSLSEEKVSYLKVLGKNFRLDKNTREKIAIFINKQNPGIFEKMSRANFRITIGDNFGEVFYKIRIGQGTELPVNDSDL